MTNSQKSALQSLYMANLSFELTFENYILGKSKASPSATLLSKNGGKGEGAGNPVKPKTDAARMVCVCVCVCVCEREREREREWCVRPYRIES